MDALAHPPATRHDGAMASGRRDVREKQAVTVDGRTIPVTNLDKVMYPVTGTTKGDVIAYYAQIAPHLVRHAQGRPATRKRWVHGVGTAQKPGQVFFEKNLGPGAPEWVATATLHHSDGDKTYPLIDDAATLVWLAQLAALEIHVPQWRIGRDGAPGNPDRMVFDLDPGEGAGLAECVEVAMLLRPVLRDMGLDPVPVTSGSKGIHLYAALDGSASSDEVSQVAHELAKALESQHPDLIISSMRKADRHGKVLLDWSQNNASKTTICPYSLRGRERPFVAVPRTWRELASPSLKHLDLHEVLTRMKKREDPMAAIEGGGAPTPSGATPSSAAAVDEDVTDDKLGEYRRRRDASKTPEPVPPPAVRGRARASARRGGQPRFVIQEHHARRLHYDVRLEHEGVFVSWALPKGLPTDPKQNRLAVHTEDHPLEYGTFEGSIPKGEYGAGTVSIWDTGTYELEKWREGEEVIVVLHGRTPESDGQRYAFIHTSGDNWLLHRMKSD